MSEPAIESAKISRSAPDRIKTVKVYPIIDSDLDEASSSFDFFVDKYVWSITDTRPYAPHTLIGSLFLATNVGFLITSIFFFRVQDPYASLTAILSDMAALASFIYHYRQLELGPDVRVRAFLAIDYVVAISTVVCSLPYFWQIILEYGASNQLEVSLSLILGAASLAFFLVGGVSSGLQYITLHSMWHILSAASASLMGHVASSGGIGS